jgi:hypothetical protein
VIQKLPPFKFPTIAEFSDLAAGLDCLKALIGRKFDISVSSPQRVESRHSHAGVGGSRPIVNLISGELCVE